MPTNVLGNLDSYNVPLVKADKGRGKSCPRWAEIVKYSFCSIFVLAICAVLFLLIYYIVFLHADRSTPDTHNRIVINDGSFLRTVEKSGLESKESLLNNYIVPQATASSHHAGQGKASHKVIPPIIQNTIKPDGLVKPSNHAEGHSSHRTNNIEHDIVSSTPFQPTSTKVLSQASSVSTPDQSTPVRAHHNPEPTPSSSQVYMTESPVKDRPKRSGSNFNIDAASNSENSYASGSEKRCIRRRLRLCDPYLDYNMTVLPNIVGDTSLEQMETSLPYFGLVLKSKCNPRIKSYVCNLLEPRCGSNKTAIPPCKKFCKVAKEGCSALILQTLKLADVFKCQQYSDINENKKCSNLAKGKSCYSSEFQCPDDTCIPKSWVCDGIRDCQYAADESNCTTCTKNEFHCDMKCIPKSWRCDSLRDCRDGMDEYNCPHTPICTGDRFLCKDKSSCIPNRWVCDGRSDCRDGSDEQDCQDRRGCQYGDFQCDNGICIPRMWRCDGQNDCKDAKDGSDERDCGPIAGYV